MKLFTLILVSCCNLISAFSDDIVDPIEIDQEMPMDPAHDRMSLYGRKRIVARDRDEGMMPIKPYEWNEEEDIMLPSNEDMEFSRRIKGEEFKFDDLKDVAKDGLEELKRGLDALKKSLERMKSRQNDIMDKKKGTKRHRDYKPKQRGGRRKRRNDFKKAEMHLEKEKKDETSVPETGRIEIKVDAKSGRIFSVNRAVPRACAVHGLRGCRQCRNDRKSDPQHKKNVNKDGKKKRVIHVHISRRNRTIKPASNPLLDFDRHASDLRRSVDDEPGKEKNSMKLQSKDPNKKEEEKPIKEMEPPKMDDPKHSENLAEKIKRIIKKYFRKWSRSISNVWDRIKNESMESQIALAFVVMIILSLQILVAVKILGGKESYEPLPEDEMFFSQNVGSPLSWEKQ